MFFLLPFHLFFQEFFPIQHFHFSNIFSSSFNFPFLCFFLPSFHLSFFAGIFPYLTFSLRLVPSLPTYDMYLWQLARHATIFQYFQKMVSLYFIIASVTDWEREWGKERLWIYLSNLITHTHTHKHSFYDERKSILSCISHLAFANKLLCVVGWKLKWPAGLHPNTGTDTGMGKLRFTPPPLLNSS